MQAAFTYSIWYICSCQSVVSTLSGGEMASRQIWPVLQHKIISLPVISGIFLEFVVFLSLTDLGPGCRQSLSLVCTLLFHQAWWWMIKWNTRITARMSCNTNVRIKLVTWFPWLALVHKQEHRWACRSQPSAPVSWAEIQQVHKVMYIFCIYYLVYFQVLLSNSKFDMSGKLICQRLLIQFCL